MLPRPDGVRQRNWVEQTKSRCPNQINEIQCIFAGCQRQKGHCWQIPSEQLCRSPLVLPGWAEGRWHREMLFFGNRTRKDPSNSAKLDPHSCASSHCHRTSAKHLLRAEYYTKFSVGGDWGDGGDKRGQWGQWLCPPMEFCPWTAPSTPGISPTAPARAAGGDTAPGHHLPPPLERGMHRAWRVLPGNIPTKNLIPGQVWEAPASQIWEEPGGTAQVWPTQGLPVHPLFTGC